MTVLYEWERIEEKEEKKKRRMFLAVIAEGLRWWRETGWGGAVSTYTVLVIMEYGIVIMGELLRENRKIGQDKE